MDPQYNEFREIPIVGFREGGMGQKWKLGPRFRATWKFMVLSTSILVGLHLRV